MEAIPFYIVTYYGCGESANELLTPESQLFINFDTAYNYFENISPELKNDYKASRYVNTDFDKYDTQGERGEYMIIESRLQLHGYYEEERNCARTPYGAVIARCYLR